MSIERQVASVVGRVNGHELRLASLEGFGDAIKKLLRAIDGNGVGEKGLVRIMDELQRDITEVKEKLSSRAKKYDGIIAKIIWTLLSAAAGAIFFRLFVGK